MREVNGLGAEMITVGFCLANDQTTANQGVTKEIEQHNIKYLASVDPTGEYMYQEANNANDLERVFKEVFYNVVFAATNSYFIDQMGDDFKLQTASYVTRGNDSAQINLSQAPTIQMQRYELYQDSQVGHTVNGVTVTQEMVGQRKTSVPAEIFETVSFNAAGTQAFSDQIDAGTTNILTDGVIHAKTFWYNTTDVAKTITLSDGTSYQLPANTFYWRIGTLNHDEFVLNYYVYLRGSMEGYRPAGTYETNNYADLRYVNYLDNNAVKHTNSPTLPWKEASVSYAFYLVDSTTGEPIVNQTTSEKGSFANAVKMSSPVVYQTVEMNSSGEIDSPHVVAEDVIPYGYSLFDPEADYTVNINSNGTGSWQVVKGTTVATTYVTSYGGNPTTALSYNDSTKDYTHTVVWFAIKYDVGPIPDVVVIDYGIGVNINVLANDLFGENGTLVGVGEAKPEGSYTSTLATGFDDTYTSTHGTAVVVDGKVRYTPSDMQMSTTDVFSYAVRHQKDGGEIRYFYSTVTVVPAANIYYEQNFVTYSGAGWTDVGTAQVNKQAEDRPGTYSLPEYDANNVYGYDQAYENCTTYSYGYAKKITVDENYYTTNESWPTAQFTFTGERFELISLTNKETGFIKVDVYAGTSATGTPVKKWAVNTYYGYSVTIDPDNPWIKTTYTYVGAKQKWSSESELVKTKGTDGVEVVPANPKDGDTFIMYRPNYIWSSSSSDNILYEVPVIRSTDLSYGTYTVVVTPMYSSVFDQTGEGSYDFYLDAVRIYNPSQTVDEYYEMDQEAYPQYIHVRQSLLNQDSFAASGSEVTGSVFIDGFATDGDISQYGEFGPNNEIYLGQSEAVAFKLDAIDASKIATVQIGMKALYGTKAQVELTGLFENGSLYKNMITATATEMFYDFGKLVVWDAQNESNIIVVRNTTDSILALTNVKLTYTSDPVAKAQLKMNYLSAKTAAEYVQSLALEERKSCEHVLSARVTKNPTEKESGEALVTCSFCDYEKTVTIPTLTDGCYVHEVTSTPTCTMSGMETYTMETEEYGAVAVFVKTPSHGHVYDGNTLPVYHSDGSASLTCKVCGQTMGFDDFERPATDASQLQILGASLRINEDIDVLFVTEIPNEYQNPYMVFTMNGEKTWVTDFMVDAQGRCYFEFTDVNPDHMGDEITAVLHATKDGEEFTDIVENYSVRQYCVNQLKRYAGDEKLVVLLSDLLYYGAAAQKYTGYRTDALVTDGLELTCGSYAIDTTRDVTLSGIRSSAADWKGASLVLRSSTVLRFTFKAASIDGLQVQVTLNGKTKTFSKEDFIADSSSTDTWSVEYTGIMATEFDDDATAVFLKDGAQTGQTISYAVNTYISRVSAKNTDSRLPELLQALFNYGMSAARYSGKIAGQN